MSNQATEGLVPHFDIADRMRKALRESGIGNQEMADYLGVSRNTVGNYINGRNRPDKRTLMLWALSTGVPFAWLETGEAPVPHGPVGGGLLPRLDSNQEPAGNWLVGLHRAA